MRIRILLAGLVALAFAPAEATTYVYLQNNTITSKSLSVSQTGTSLSSSYWRQTTSSVGAGKRASYLWFGRDTGITNGKFFYFGTSAVGGGYNFGLHQALRGDWIGSTMWQLGCDQSACDPWYSDRSWHDRYGSYGGKTKQMSYRAYFTGGDDDIEYVLTERPAALTGEGSSTTFNVLAWNVYMRPTTLFANGQMIRAGLIPSYVANYDAIIFSEAFDDDARAELVNRLKSRFPYRTSIVGADSGIKQDGGVIIFSRFPIEVQAQKTFGSTCASDDCLADKGIMYARINKYGRRYHVFGTHTQAHTSANDIATRKAQFVMLRDFVTSRNIPATEAVLIGGDLNVDRIKYPTEYSEMLSTLQAAHPSRSGHAYSYDRNTNGLASEDGREYLDYVLYSTRHLRPATASNEVLFLKTNRPWKEFVWEGDYWDLSDHYGLYGRFSF